MTGRVLLAGYHRLRMDLCVSSLFCVENGSIADTKYLLQLEVIRYAEGLGNWKTSRWPYAVKSTAFNDSIDTKGIIATTFQWTRVAAAYFRFPPFGKYVGMLPFTMSDFVQLWRPLFPHNAIRTILSADHTLGLASMPGRYRRTCLLCPNNPACIRKDNCIQTYMNADLCSLQHDNRVSANIDRLVYSYYWPAMFRENRTYTGLILGLRPANERRCY